MQTIKKSYGFYLFVWTAVLLSTGSINAQRSVHESDIKAAFVYNFTKYIEWPESKSEQIICIGFIGETSVKQSLMRLIEKKNLEDQITIKSYEVTEEIVICNILIIVDHNDLTDLIGASAKENNILIITDNAKPFPKGACINLLKMGPKFRFEISQDNLKSLNLKVSAQLLKLAISTNKK